MVHLQVKTNIALETYTWVQEDNYAHNRASPLPLLINPLLSTYHLCSLHALCIYKCCKNLNIANSIAFGLPSVSFAGKISPDGPKKFKNANFGKKIPKIHFLITKFFIQFDHFHPIWPIFIHLRKFSSDYDDSIQNLDESAALFISLVPHAR
jgi:hypothetical protein